MGCAHTIDSMPSAAFRGRRLLATTIPLVFLAAVACAPADEESPTDEPAAGEDTDGAGAADAAEDSGADQCQPGSIDTLEPDTLTIATSDPAYEPWMVD